MKDIFKNNNIKKTNFNTKSKFNLNFTILLILN